MVGAVEMLVLMVPIGLGLLLLAVLFATLFRLVKLSQRTAEAQEETNRLLGELGAERTEAGP